MKAAEKHHKTRLAEIGCIVCRKEFGITDGPVQLHHLRSGGWGKGDFTTLIPLCYEHHMGDTGIHGMGTKAFERRYGPQIDLLNMAKELVTSARGQQC